MLYGIADFTDREQRQAFVEADRDRPSQVRLVASEAFVQQIRGDHRVRAALGLLHDLADEEAEQPVLAAAVGRRPASGWPRPPARRSPTSAASSRDLLDARGARRSRPAPRRCGTHSSKISLPILPLIVPSSTRRTSSDSRSGGIGESAIVLPSALSAPSSSVSIQFAIVRPRARAGVRRDRGVEVVGERALRDQRARVVGGEPVLLDVALEARRRQLGQRAQDRRSSARRRRRAAADRDPGSSDSRSPPPCSASARRCRASASHSRVSCTIRAAVLEDAGSGARSRARSRSGRTGTS